MKLTIEIAESDVEDYVFRYFDENVSYFCDEDILNAMNLTAESIIKEALKKINAKVVEDYLKSYVNDYSNFYYLLDQHLGKSAREYNKKICKIKTELDSKNNRGLQKAIDLLMNNGYKVSKMKGK